MISGVVNARREALVRLVVLGVDGREREFETVIDTGFNGSLTLPPVVIAELGLPWRTRGVAVLANGREEQFEIHTATVVWDGFRKNILVQAADTDPLLGMGLLYGYSLHIDVFDGVDVTITPAR